MATVNSSERAPEPVLSDQQVPGAGDRQELGDALDDAEQDDLKQIFHAPPVGVRQLKAR